MAVLTFFASLLTVRTESLLSQRNRGVIADAATGSGKENDSVFKLLFSRCVDRDVYLLGARNPFGIDLRGGLGIVASDGMEIAIDGLVRLIRQ